MLLSQSTENDSISSVDQAIGSSFMVVEAALKARPFTLTRNQKSGSSSIYLPLPFTSRISKSISGKDTLASSAIGGAIIAETLNSLSERQLDTSILFTCMREKISNSMARLLTSEGKIDKEIGSKR